MPPPASWCATPCRHSRGCDILPLLVFLLFPALLPSSAAHSTEARTLSVGEELVGETMPLRHDRRVYRIDGLRPSAWYEVKIYPASIPSSFSIQLLDDHDSAENLGSKNRRLLNTEKIIFKAESSDPVYVLVTVETEGVIAKPNVLERELALFNIENPVIRASFIQAAYSFSENDQFVCDELMLGIPHFAFWVGIGALLCIVLALLAPLVLPLNRLLNYEPAELRKADTAKMS